jgi:hypothetical protein
VLALVVGAVATLSSVSTSDCTDWAPLADQMGMGLAQRRDAVTAQACQTACCVDAGCTMWQWCAASNASLCGVPAGETGCWLGQPSSVVARVGWHGGARPGEAAL